MWSTSEVAPYIVLNSEKVVAVRSRFNVAHELGHLILHRNIPPGCLTRPEIFDVVERQAHAFASAFLMPAKTFSNDAVAPSLEGFRSLKSKWKVSIQAMIVRAEDLGLLPPEKSGRIWPNLARRGWRKLEPLDDVMISEQPRLLQRSLDLILGNRAASLSELTHHTALSQLDIEDLLGLQRGYLDPLHDEQLSVEPAILRFPSAG